MAAHGVPDMGPQFVPTIRLGNDGISEGAGYETTLGFVLVDLKDDLGHGFKVAHRGAEREVLFAPIGRRLGCRRAALPAVVSG